MPHLPSIRAFTNLTVEKLEDRTNPAPLYVDNHVLLAPRPDSDPGGVIAGVRATGLVDTVRPIGFGIYLAKLKAGVTVTVAVPAVGGLPGVKFAEPDYKMVKDVFPNDTHFVNGNLWGPHNTGQNGGTPNADFDGPEGWALGTGTRQTIVAVLDDGIDTTHPDLAANMWVNTGEIPGDGIDNDGNGYIDDVYGYDFGNGDSDPNPDPPDGHGTHVGGIIGAVGNNGIGVTGVNWNTRLMAVKIFGANGGMSAVVEGMNYAADNGAKILNNSYAFIDIPRPAAMETAIAALQNRGIIAVTSAGNQARDNDTHDRWPSNFAGTYDNVIAVAALDRNDNLASFSNTGAGMVAIGAPGVDIWSTVPGGYESQQGTSMSSPQVAGALALAWDQFPTATYQELIQALKNSAVPIPALTGKSVTGGRLNLNNLLSQLSASSYATGAGAGGGPLVKVFRGSSAQSSASFFAYDPAFTGGVRVVTTDLNGDKFSEVITAPGQGGGPHIRIFDGKTFQQIGSFFAFESEFRGGLFVAAADMDGDKVAEIIVSADTGGGPRVSIFKPNIGPDAVGATLVANFFAYDVGFTGGVRIAAADFDGDGLADLAVAPGFGGGPHVKVFSGLDLLAGQYDEPMRSFMAGDVNGRNGLFIAGGDMNADKVADIIVGSGAGTPVVRVYDGVNLNLFVQTFPTGGEVPGLIVDTTNIDGTLNNRTFPLNLIPPAAPPGQLPPTTDKTQRDISGYLYGIRVGTHDVNNDGVADLLLAAGPADLPTVSVLNGKTLTEMRAFNAYEDFFYGGVFIGGAGDPLAKVTT